MTASDAVDVELLGLAETVLVDAGYDVDRRSDEAFEHLVAEDRDGVLMVAALISVETVIEAEPLLVHLLTQRIGKAESPKRWDAYAVMLTVGNIDDEQAEPLFQLAYDLSRVRRIVRSGVRPTRADVERALRPILPLSSATRELTPLDPVESLHAQLIADGVPPADVEVAMAEFRSWVGDLSPGVEASVAETDVDE